MVFSSLFFLFIFLPSILLIYYMTKPFSKGMLSNIVLLFASLFFYAWGEPVYVLLMIFSIIFNWIIGVFIERWSSKKSVLLLFCLFGNLSLLAYYKYTGLIINLINTVLNINIENRNIPLPIGISFFTFQALSYVIDVYRGDCRAQKNISKLALYIALFPQLIAGPIVRYKDINEQIDKRIITIDKFAEGVRRFIYGLGKKVLISNVLAKFVDDVYALDIGDASPLLIWCVMISYSLQIYYDFSGYSDMAIGLGKMFGFDFKENFRYPYISVSMNEFWRRWHISLNTWFREYVYIPLGGNRKGKYRTYLNLGIVFLLTGIWHGASYNFIFWGLYHGVFVIAERLFLGKYIEKNKYLGWIYTFFVVNIGWIFFRVEGMSLAFNYVRKVFWFSDNWLDVNILFEYSSVLFWIILCLGLIGSGMFQKLFFNNWESVCLKWKCSLAENIYLVVIFGLSIISLVSNTYNPFIYFRF